jgi:hypothetical protein
MPDLQSAVEEFLAGLPPDEWRALCARVREPSEPLLTEPSTTERVQR